MWHALDMRSTLLAALLAWRLADDGLARVWKPRGHLPIKRAYRLKRRLVRWGMRADGRLGRYTLAHT